MQATRTAHLGAPIVTASDAEFVSIRILRDAHERPTGLDVRTGTSRDPIIYWTPPGEHRHPALAREVLWNTVDLHRSERIQIVPKPGQHEFFRWEEFELDARHFNVTTGDVISPGLKLLARGDAIDELPVSPVSAKELKSHAAKVRGLWHYNVVLHSPHLAVPLTLDPVIIIVEEP